MKWGNWKGEHSLSTHRCEIIGEGLQAWTRECDDCNHTIHSPQCHMFAPHWLKSCTHAHTHSIASTCGIGKKQVSVCFCAIFLIMLKRQNDSEWTAFICSNYHFVYWNVTLDLLCGGATGNLPLTKNPRTAFDGIGSTRRSTTNVSTANSLKRGRKGIHVTVWV